MPTGKFSVEEYFAGYLINWDAIKKAHSYREPRWRTWLRKLRKKVNWWATICVTPRK